MSDNTNPRTKALTLARAVTFGGISYDHLDLSAPTVAQMEAAARETNAVAANVMLVANNAKVPPGAVREMDWDDMEAAVEFLQGFTRSAPKTGAN